MLLTCCVLFLAFAINYSSEKVLVNSYITSLLITGLLLIKTVSTKIYRAPWMNILEISFLCNLEVLLVTVCYIKGSTIDDSVICTITNVSVTISLTTFIGIVAYLLMHRTMQVVPVLEAGILESPAMEVDSTKSFLLKMTNMKHPKSPCRPPLTWNSVKNCCH